MTWYKALDTLCHDIYSMRMQTTLFERPEVSDSVNYTQRFKNLYYHLYSNSNASRADKIISELARILLVKLGAEKLKKIDLLDRNLKGSDDDVHRTLDFLAEAFPSLRLDDRKYNLDIRSVKLAFEQIMSINLHDAPAHIIGDAFQALVGPKIRGDKGQFFTPGSVTDAIVEILAPKLDERILDPACGTGGFLSSAQKYLERTYGCGSSNGNLYGIDKDHDLAYLASALLEISTKGAATVVNRNSLEIIKDGKLDESIEEIDVIAANPPFGSKIKITDEHILCEYTLGKVWDYNIKDDTWHMTDQILAAQDPQILFIELCVKLLKPGGRMGLVLPEGVFGNKTLEYVWQYLRDNGTVYAMIDCPRTTFQPYTDIKTNLLFFVKGEKSSDAVLDVAVAVALKCGHDKRGRSSYPSGDSVEDDFVLISGSFRKDNMKDYWKMATISSNYYVPRYHTNSKDADAMSKYGEIVTLGYLLSQGHISIKRGHEVGSESYGTGEVPFIRTSDINNLEISSDPTNSVSEEIYSAYSKKQSIKAGDILMVADGRYRIGKTAIISENIQKCVIQSHVKIISVKKSSPILAYELLYMLNMPEVQNQIRNMVFVQSTLGTLGDRIKEVRLAIPNRTDDWKSVIDNFRRVIITRAELLEKLKSIANEAEV